jgi:hypothetical protein
MEVNSKFIELENEIMKMLLEGQNDTFAILRRQYSNSTVASREFSSVGFFISFSVPEDIDKLQEKESFHLGGVTGQINGVTNGVGFILYIRNGVIKLLEGYTYGEEKWPEKLTEYKLYRLQD